MTIRKKRITSSILALIILTTLAVIISNDLLTRPIIFSPKTLLSNTWERYKGRYLEEGTYRTLDKEKNNITTSEGQSYTMLRAVWMDDKQTFDNSWRWTKDNLQRDKDALFSWLFGEMPDGSYGILNEKSGANSASDADVDIAMSLLFAYSRWQDTSYLEEAREIINAIWEKEVIIIKGKPYLAASNVDKEINSPYIAVNPSYLAPYAYRIFQEVDPAHNWEGLVDTSYDVVETSMGMNLDTDGTAQIPPNWVTINRITGQITAATNLPTENTAHSNFGFDAMRTPWRIALDWKWFNEPRAERIAKNMEFFTQEWTRNERIHAEYAHDGRTIEYFESPAIYGGLIGYFVITDSQTAQEVYANKLAALYNPDFNDWQYPLTYYDDNWVWLGIALYNDLLPNLWRDVS